MAAQQLRNRVVHFWLPLLLVAVAVASLGTLFRAWWFGFDILANFPMQFTVVALGGLLTSLLLRGWWLVLGFALVFLFNGVKVAPLYLSEPLQRSETFAPLSIGVINVHTANQAYDRVVEAVLQKHPDVVVFMEVNRPWMTALQQLEESYPHRIALPRSDNFGIAVFSRLAFQSSKILASPPENLPTAIVRVSTGQAHLTIIGTHPLPPHSGYASACRDTQLAHVALLAAETEGNVAVVGDFNATPWSHAFESLLVRGELHDTLPGFGCQATWPSAMPVCWIPLDHIVVSEGIGILDRAAGPAIGSDHFPVWATLAIPVPLRF